MTTTRAAVPMTMISEPLISSDWPETRIRGIKRESGHGRFSEAPPSLAVRGALTEPENGQGCDPEDEGFVPPYGVTETRPGTLRRREMRTVLRLECVGDAAEVGGPAYLSRLTFDNEVQPIEPVAPGRQDATRVAREVLGFALIRAGAEVKGAV